MTLSNKHSENNFNLKRQKRNFCCKICNCNFFECRIIFSTCAFSKQLDKQANAFPNISFLRAPYFAIVRSHFFNLKWSVFNNCRFSKCSHFFMTHRNAPLYFIKRHYIRNFQSSVSGFIRLDKTPKMFGATEQEKQTQRRTYMTQ